MNLPIGTYLLCTAASICSGSEGSTERPTPGELPESVKNFLCGVVGGLAFVYSGQPLDKIKTLLQTSNGEYSGALDCLAKTVRQQGIRGLYAGVMASLAAEVSVNAFEYSSFQEAKSTLMAYDVPEPLAILLAGCGAGVLSSSIYTPMELLKIRMQTQSSGQVLSCSRPIFNAECCSIAMYWNAPLGSHSVKDRLPYLMAWERR